MKKELILYVVVNSIKNYKIFDLNLYFVFVSYFIFSRTIRTTCAYISSRAHVRTHVNLSAFIHVMLHTVYIMLVSVATHAFTLLTRS